MKLVEVAKIPREDILEILEEKRDNIASNNHLYQASMKAKLKKKISSERTYLENSPSCTRCGWSSQT